MQSSADVAAPPFARLDAEATAATLPIMISGRAVAVLYADGPNDAVSGAFATLEVLARHASAVVALRTAMRTLDVLRGVSPDAPGGSDALGDDQGARHVDAFDDPGADAAIAQGFGPAMDPDTAAGFAGGVGQPLRVDPDQRVKSFDRIAGSLRD